VGAGSVIKPIGHEDRLSLVDHLDELRKRLIVSVVALVIAFGVCVAFNDPLLQILNDPLERTTQQSIKKGHGLPGQIEKTQQALRQVGAVQSDITAALSHSRGLLSAAERRALLAHSRAAQQALATLPRTQGNRPVTLRVGEPFSTTLVVSLYFALILSLPVILYQLYAFILPAFSPRERGVALPLMAMIPLLFIAGVVFGYFVVLPPAVRFLQNFNSDAFNVLVQASDYYKFEVMALLGLGILFQIPVGMLAVTRLGIVTPRQLRKNRRYALLVIAVVAMLLPGTDPVTMLISMVPLVVLFELSIVLSSVLGTPAGDDAGDDSDDEADDDEDLLAGLDDDDDEFSDLLS
jgi:sec-independent protein translocase protein TatC